ncbi:MAG TPA: hypothetical protein PLI95_07350 [Polyangiaceae bacterium]|nr:hypothetical protein [Polyangiaceae bacterium]
MKILTASILTTSALCAFLALGCSNGSTASGTQSGPQNPEFTQRGMNAPLIVRVRGPEPVPAGGDIKVDVEVHVNEPLKFPVTLQVRTPANAQLLSGQPAEVLQLNSVGVLTRSYMVRVNGPLQSPIVVTADGRDPGGAMGLHAERTYPAAAAGGTVTNTQRPPIVRPTAPPR